MESLYLNHSEFMSKCKYETAKQNQKIPFHFLSAPPTPPAEEKKKGKENFWFCSRDRRERTRRAG